MYEIYQKILDEKKLKSSDVSRGTGISNMTLSDWKHGKSKPKMDKMKKIAEYLGVSVDYLMTGKEPEFDNLSDEMAIMLAKIQKDTELAKALQKYFAMSDEQKKCILDTINLMIRE